ncbi:hypothetical protein JG687_00016131 [Phytophthora cactorum]|uniref:Uncharacterized protein n=1 Tax=Phytophthora cactorum TaxID=29920 RepID=A0A8T1TRG1_9STRA|nr:hypothetical protein JG687_00016131 [Phytophthora cactorum]
MKVAATRQHAHQNTVYNCHFAHFKLCYSKQHLAQRFEQVEPDTERLDEDLCAHWIFLAGQTYVGEDLLGGTVPMAAELLPGSSSCVHEQSARRIHSRPSHCDLKVVGVANLTRKGLT